MERTKIWFHGVRGPFLIASAIPVLFGGALSSLYIEKFEWYLFLFTLLGIVVMHAAANMSNEYFDYYNKTDVVNKHRTIFSGGSGLLVNGKIDPKTYKTVFLALYLTTLIIGLIIMINLGNKWWVVFALAVIGFTLTYFYSCPPINFAHRGLGEIIVGLCFAPLPIFGTYYVITRNFDLVPFLTSIPLMMLIIAVLWINQFPDIEADSFAKKENLVVRLDPKKARFVYYTLMTLTYLGVIALVAFKYLPWYSLAGILTIPIAIKASVILHKNYNRPKEIFPAMGLTILNHHLTGILLIGSLLLEKFTS